MSTRNRIGSVTLGVVTVLLMGGLPLLAQEPSTSKSGVAAAKKKDTSRRVPTYFGQIGLTTEQRASIYSIQAKRHEKIDALEQQIATERAEMLADSEKVLNETQKKLLETLRKAEPTSKPATPAKPTESSKP